MSSEEGTTLRSGRILDLTTHTRTLDSATMTDTNVAETEFVGASSVSSQVAELKYSFEINCNALQSEIGKLRDLLKAMMEKPNNLNSHDQCQSKVLQSNLRTGLTLYMMTRTG